MYLPAAFQEERLAVLHAAIRAHPLGVLITAGPQGLLANSVPFLIDDAGGGQGVLRAHLARANPQLADLAAVDEALVVFQGPQAYVSPALYPSKAEHGKVVPTWNYVQAHAWGRPRVIDDAVWLRGQIGALTDRQEAPRADPWAVDDAPDGFIAAQMRGIVGVEIPIVRIEGKWKVSQNRNDADRQGVADGLRAIAPEIAALVEGGGAPR